jgi:hypothetical protein
MPVRPLNQVQTFPTPTPEPEGPGLFDRLFPKRDPVTGEQGGLLANPLFRIGMSLLARSGPTYQPRDFGQILAGTVGDFAQFRSDEEAAQVKFLEGQQKKKEFQEFNDKTTWGEDFAKDFYINPTGESSALKVKGPDGASAGGTIATPSTPYHTRLKGLESAGGKITTNPLNPKVSGVYQFSDDTRKVLDTALGLSSLDRSQEKEDARIAEYDRRSAAALQMSGLPVNDANMYATHLLGWRGGPNFVRLAMQSPDTPTSMALSSAILNDNPWLKNKTMGQAYDYIDRSISAGAWAPKEAQASAPPQNLGFFSSTPGKSLGLPPQAAPPSPPAVAQQGTFPTSAASGASPQTQAPPPAAGGPVPISLYGPDGKVSKNAILQTLNTLEPGERNRLIIGALAKAGGNKREFAENLGEALLARSSAAASARPRDFQQYQMIDPATGRKIPASYDPSTGQFYEPDGRGGLKPVPVTAVPSTAGAAAPLSQVQFDKLANTLMEDEIGLQKIDKYVQRIAKTNVGAQRWFDEVASNFKTLIGGRENGLALTEAQLNLALARGDLETLVGLFRIDIVGPGVMTKQDAEFIRMALGGDVSILQNPEKVKELMKSMIENKVRRMQPNLDSYNRNAPYYVAGFQPKILDIPDTSKWEFNPNMKSSLSPTPPSKYKITVPNAKGETKALGQTSNEKPASKYQIKTTDGKVIQ